MEQVTPRVRTDAYIAVDGRVREATPRLAARAEADAAVHDGFVRTAYEALGSRGRTPHAPWGGVGLSRTTEQLMRVSPPSGGDRLVDNLLRNNRVRIPVVLGTGVDLPGQRPDDRQWVVVGAGSSDRIELARRSPDGQRIERAVRRWPQLVLANPSLAVEHVIPTGPSSYPVMIRPVEDAVAGARLGQVPSELVSMQPVPDGTAQSVLTHGTWEELAGSAGLTRLRPIPTFPSDSDRAIRLATLADPDIRRVTVGEEAVSVFNRTLLVGIGELAADHRAAPDAARLERISAWFDALDMPTWQHGDEVLLHSTGAMWSIGNASAFGAAEFAGVSTGPREFALVDEMTRYAPTALREELMSSERTVRSNWDAVLAHEVSHVALGKLWGHDPRARLDVARAAGATDEAARLVEFGIVHEAFSDLFGASYVERPGIGVRSLSRLRNGYGDLEQLRRTVLAAGEHAAFHTGTQLLTKPMLHVQRTHGWSAMAEVTASASHRLAAQLGRTAAEGGIDTIDLPAAARALRDAAASRFGESDDAVRALTRSFQRLKVLV